jgi:hypothetical protein
MDGGMIRGYSLHSRKFSKSNLKVLKYDTPLQGESEGSHSLLCKLSDLISDME